MWCDGWIWKSNIKRCKHYACFKSKKRLNKGVFFYGLWWNYNELIFAGHGKVWRATSCSCSFVYTQQARVKQWALWPWACTGDENRPARYSVSCGRSANHSFHPLIMNILSVHWDGWHLNVLFSGRSASITLWYPLPSTTPTDFQ